MKVIIYLIGLGHIALCTYLILYTRTAVEALKELFQTYPLKHLSAIPALYALLFLISAFATTHQWVFVVVGLLASAEALVAFMNPRKIYRQMLDWYFRNVSDRTNQLFGIIGIVFGTLIMTWTK